MPYPLEEPFGEDWDTVRRNFQNLGKDMNPPVPQARVYSTAAHAAVANTATGTLLFDTESYDNGDLHSTSVNTGRLTASITGLYMVVGSVATTALVAGGRAYLNIAKNGTSEARGTSMAAGAGEGNVAAQVRLLAGEYVELTLSNFSGASITPLAGVGLTWFAMARLGGYVNQGV